MASYQERVGTRIRAERKKRGLSREEAARLAGISFRQYQRWETGKSDPRDSNLRQLAEAWGLTTEDLRPPDPEHEERDVRQQLDRIESLLEQVLDYVGGPERQAEVIDLPADERAVRAVERPAPRTPAPRRAARKAPGGGQSGSSDR